MKEEIRNDGVLSTISVRRTERTDTAIFTCVATNAFGSDDTIINLIIQEVPETPSELKVLDKSGRNVKLSWQAPYNGNSNLTRYLIEFKPTKGTWQNDIDRVLVGGEETIAGVFSLRPATSYHFRIVAQNTIGSSGPSDTITVETSEEAPSGPPVDIRLSAADQHTLLVSWKPPLKEHWNGDILGYYGVCIVFPGSIRWVEYNFVRVCVFARVRERISSAGRNCFYLTKIQFRSRV